MAIRLAAFSVGVMAVSAPLPAAEPQLWKDWVAGCDQTLKCRAVGMPPEEQAAGLLLILDRDSGAQGQLQLRLTAPDAMPPGQVSLLIDGMPFEGRVARDADAAVWQGDYALTIARLLASGRVAEVQMGGKAPVALSLAGAAAAMLFIDETQGRVGSKGALVRPGRKTDSSQAIPRRMVMPYRGARTAPAPATLAAAVRARGVLKGMDCNASGTSSDQALPLDATHTLVLLECGSGAYNMVQQPFLVRAGDPASATPVGGELADGVVNAEFDPRHRTLGGLTKGRGIGDCGSIDRWAWTGKAFVRVERTLMDVCRGVPPVWWITVERAGLAVAL